MAHGLMVLSGLLAFVLMATVMGDRSERIQVAVAQADIAAGAILRSTLVKPSELAADSPLASSLVSLAMVRSGKWTATRAIAAGDPIRRSDLARSQNRPGLRSMSISVARENAVGGALGVGDKVDVIDVVDGRAVFVVTDVEVTKVATPMSSGGITRGAGREFFVVVQVDPSQALALAEALADGKLDVVRSTGAASAPLPEPPLPSETDGQDAAGQ
ncbi:MAG TPA: hypothetical protein VM142_11215 [Acidimicrobiales bacterium]|nr:hypothetical protein [Acidimicrobiales bacterium]